MKWCLLGREYCFDTKYPNGGFCHVQLYHIGKCSYYASFSTISEISQRPPSKMEAQWLTVKARLVMFCKTPMPLLRRCLMWWSRDPGVQSCPSEPRSISKPPWWVLVMSADWSEMNLRRAKMLVPWSVFWLKVNILHLFHFPLADQSLPSP